MYCSKCGQLNDDNSKFCIRCGQPLGTEQQGQEGMQPSASQKKKGKSVVIVSLLAVVAVFVLVTVCVIFMVVLPAKEKKEASNELKWQSVDTEEVERSTEAIAGETQEVEQNPEVVVSYTTVGECSAICDEMSVLDYSQSADENVLRAMAGAALQMEYAKSGNGAPQKLYTHLDSDDEAVLLYHIFRDFSFRHDIACLDEYQMWESSDSGSLFKISAAEQFLRDFYGKDEVDFSEISYFEDQGDGYALFAFGDGDPWYTFENYSIKENEDFYLLEGACSYGDNGGDHRFVGYAKYLFVKNADAPLGVTLVYSEFDNQENGNLAVAAAASSTLKGQGKKTYGVSHLLDGDHNTCWVEGVSGTGVGETIEIDLGETKTVYGLIIYNGYLESKYLYGINGKVTRVSVSTADGSTVQSDLLVPEYEETKESFEFYDEVNFGNWINFEQPVYTDKITITIEGAVAGSKYDDTCISEIRVY